MKYFILLIFIWSVALHAQNTPSSTSNQIIEKEVNDAFNSLVLASKALDSDAYFKHFDKDKFVGLNSDGSNWNSISDLEPLIHSGFSAIDKVLTLEFTNVNISIIDSFTAILVNEYKQEIMLKDGTKVKLAGGGTQVWSKHTGSWKLVSISASNAPRKN